MNLEPTMQLPSTTRRRNPLRRMMAVAALSALPALSAAPAPGCSATSPAHRVALLELYTSEGCSSCPPADRWLGELLPHYPMDRVLPLALHVDYWDYIGWRDPYGQPAFAERQRQLGRLAGSSTIYTPEVFLGLRELRNWRAPGEVDRQIRTINRQPACAGIGLTLRQASTDRLEVEAHLTLEKSAVAGRRLRTTLVLYEDGLTSSVPAGENRGRTLRHEHVVRYWTATAVDATQETQTLARNVALPKEWNPARLGAAAFVEDAASGEILQAVATPTCLSAPDQASPNGEPP